MSNSELKDGLAVKGRAYSAVGKLTADFGEGERVYVLAALNPKEYMLNNTVSTKEVSVLLDVEAAVDKSPEWFAKICFSDCPLRISGVIRSFNSAIFFISHMECYSGVG